MSVMILDLKVLEKVYVTIAQHRYRNDELCNLTFSETQLRIKIALLAEMNRVSYYTRHPSSRGIDWGGIREVYDVIEKWNYNYLKAEPCDDVQLYKYLQCIAYQIENYHMEDKHTWKADYDCGWKWLKRAIEMVLRHIVESTPEYEAAKWAEV